MWANRHPLAWPTHDSRDSQSPESGPSLSRTNITHIRVLLACWFCTSGSRLSRRQFEPNVQRTWHLVCATLHEDGNASVLGATCSYDCNCLLGDDCSPYKVTQSVADGSSICVQAASRPSFRVVACRGLACLLKVETAGNWVFSGSVQRQKFLLFDLCQHSFYFLSRFLVKYFKYFKGCGFRI